MDNNRDITSVFRCQRQISWIHEVYKDLKAYENATGAKINYDESAGYPGSRMAEFCSPKTINF